MTERVITKSELLAWCDRELGLVKSLIAQAHARTDPAACLDFYLEQAIQWTLTRSAIAAEEPWRMPGEWKSPP